MDTLKEPNENSFSYYDSVNENERTNIPSSYKQLYNKVNSNWTRKEKVLVLCSTLLAVLLICFVSLHFSRQTQSVTVSQSEMGRWFNMWGSSNVCRSSFCKETARNIQASLNKSVNPCDDFYRFSCGGWIANNPLSSDKSSLDTFTELQDRNNKVLIQTIEGDYIPDNSLSENASALDKEMFMRLKDTYNTCMNVSGINFLNLTPMLTFLESQKKSMEHMRTFYRGRPGSGLRRNFFANTISSLQNMGVSTVFSSEVSEDDGNPDTMAIFLTQNGLGLPAKEFYDDKDIIVLYRSVVEKMMSQFPSVFDSYDVSAIANAVVDFETAIADITVPEAEMGDPSVVYNPFTLQELNVKFGTYFNFDVFYSLRFAQLPKHEHKSSVHEPVFVIRSLPFFEKWYSLLKSVRIDTFQYYVLWQLILAFGEGLPSEARKPLFELKEALSGQKTEKTRNETCIGQLDRFYGFALSKYFVKSTFKPAAKTAALEFIYHITDAFKLRLHELDWIDNITVEKALIKANSLRNKTGYPDYIIYPANVTKRYDGAYPVKNKYIETLVSLASWSDYYDRSRLFFPPDRSEWDMTPSTVNAYYSPEGNEIVFPSGILQPPFYALDSPNYLNYGAIGAVVGHELTHAYDNNGRKYDWNGRLVDWWSQETAKKFEDKAKCFVDQYSNFSIVDPRGRRLHVNGKLTLGENLADNGGIARAWEAWKTDLASAGGAQRNLLLPGLYKTYTPEQLFFMSFAGVWCSNTTPESLVQQIRKNPHSPANFRVWGVVQNSKSFAEAFQCAPGAAMNPVDKCSIW